MICDFIGARSSFLASPPEFFDGGSVSENGIRSSNPFSVHPMPVDDMKLPVEVSIISFISACRISGHTM